MLADAGMSWLSVATEHAANEDETTNNELEALTRAAKLLDESIARRDESSDDPGQSYDPLIVASRGGEAYARLHAITRDPLHLTRAIELLERARSEGHMWPELSGHLGDLYYRRGRRDQNVLDLDRAVELKLQGQPTRENRSVLAAANLIKFILLGKHHDLERAALYAEQAAIADPTWPWPPLQQAAIARAALDAGLFLDIGSPTSFEHQAARLAVQNTEFGELTLGGQRRDGRAVYCLADRHQLLETTLVLKRLGTADAQRERQVTEAFNDYLRATSSPDNWQVPTALEVVDHPHRLDRSVYVMARRNAPTLAELSERNTGAAALHGHLDNIARFLAAYQAWERTKAETSVLIFDGRRAKKLTAPIVERVHKYGLSNKQAGLFGQQLGSVMTSNAVAVAKRDAHAGNWIVDETTIVAIDLEAHATVPVLWELIALAYDQPFFTPDDDGWGRLERLTEIHLEELNQRGVSVAINDADLRRTLQWYATTHIVTTIARLHNSQQSSRASEIDRRHTQARLRHCLANLTYLTTTADPVLNDLIAQIAVS